MKTAISIPDNVFDQAEILAKTMKISRSQLFTIAISEFLEEHTSESITRKLNEIYSEESNSLDPRIGVLQYDSLEHEEEW